MKASEAKFLDFIKKSPQFVIPIYQRTYSWTERECKQLWDDIVRTGKDDSITAHFVGSIVYIEKGLYQVTSQSPLLVIDGQQRLTTVTILLAALAEALEELPEGEREPVDGFSPRKLQNYYLINPEEEGERHYKLILSQTDRDSLLAVVKKKQMPKEKSIRIAENYDLFTKWISGYNGDLETLCKGIAKLVVVDIALNRDQDNPQLIFESMNSTGRELTQADLIRNFILMGLEPALQTRLYEEYWRLMEIDFGQEAYSTLFDAFMRHYLTLKTGEIPRMGEVYDAFKAHARTTGVMDTGVEALVSDIRTFAGYFCAMALGTETDHALKAAFHDLRELKVDVVYPFLLELYDDYRNQILSKDDFLEAVRLVESYVFRRSICAIPTNSLNKTFATFSKGGSFNKEHYLSSIKWVFGWLPSYRRFPDDNEFMRHLQTRDLYNFPRRNYWLRRLENYGRKERVNVDEYTTEHIMPQNKNLSKAWREALGPEWGRVHETWLHTLGNLTLTGYNSEYSDRSFEEKRDMKGGFKQSPIILNQGLGQLDEWNENTIKERAIRLSNEAISVWPSPPEIEIVLIDDNSSTQTPTNSGYTINDHPYLLSGVSSQLFEAIRKEILAIDPVVTEEFLKKYVAYKAETNFVDIYSQSNRLALTLNMKYHEIDDPKNICIDITGQRLNGDIKLFISSIDELPYVMGLIRQSFERQMDNGGSE